MSFSGLLNQSGTIAAKGDPNKYGKTSFGSNVTVLMRFEKKKRTIMKVDKTVEPIDGIVFVGSGTTVGVGDKLIYSGITYRVMDVEDVVLGNGQVHHKELKVQEANL